jgi:hypothetical protein
MADKLYQQVIETENYNIRLGFTSKGPPVTVVDKVCQHNHQKMLFYDPADPHMNNVNGKPAYLVFYADSVQETNVEDSFLVNIDHHSSKALQSKIDYDRLSPYFVFRLHARLCSSENHNPSRQTQVCCKILWHSGKDRRLPCLRLSIHQF